MSIRVGRASRRERIAGSNIVALAAVCLGASAWTACRPAPERIRVLEVRSLERTYSAPEPADLLTLTPAATPTFPRLDLTRPAALDNQLPRGWSIRNGPLRFRREAVIRFWIGKPRALRLRGRARFEGPDQASSPRLSARLGQRPLGKVELSATTGDVSFEIPAEALRAGTNIVFLSAPQKGRAIFEALLLEDATTPDEEPARAVEVLTEGGPAPVPGVEVRHEGPLRYLLELPREPQRLEVGIACERGDSDEPPRFSIRADGDDRTEILLQGEAAYGALLGYDVPLGSFAGGPLRLGLELSGLPAGARCVWVEPRLRAVGPAPESAPPRLRAEGASLIVIVLDAAARDRLGLYGSTTGATPVIDDLANESLVFDGGVAQASYTLASTGSLFTGLLPPTHRVAMSSARKPRELPAETPTFAEVLAEAGYATIQFTGNPNSVRLGLGRGFEQVVYPEGHGPVRRATDYQQPIQDWLAGHADGPFFLYVHYVQPHNPYDAAPDRFYVGLDPAYEGRFDGSHTTLLPLFNGALEAGPDDVAQLQHLYDGNLRFADWALGELLRVLRDRGVLETSVLLVTADHGESLGERGEFGHGKNVHRETVPIPLLVRFPARFGLTGRRQLPLGTVDLMPTLLDFVGVAPPQGIWGRSRLALLEDPGQSDWPRPLPAWAGAGRAGSVAVYGAGHKYVFDSRICHEGLLTVEDQEDGPDVRSDRPVTFDYLAFASYVPDAPDGHQDGEVSADPAETPGVDDETAEALRALGYVE